MGGFFWRIRQSLQRFMRGRYGTDKLNMLILGTGCCFSIANIFVRFWPVNVGLATASYILLGIALFRMLSRNTYKRYQENRRLLNFLGRCRDKGHKYYRCPRCRQQVRVPKGKGKISITCPKCKEKFIKKT